MYTDTKHPSAIFCLAKTSFFVQRFRLFSCISRKRLCLIKYFVHLINIRGQPPLHHMHPGLVADTTVAKPHNHIHHISLT